ncbi:MAG: T9SS type A sorting domain-containing protein, partial [Bacteroidota bacterium]
KNILIYWHKIFAYIYWISSRESFGEDMKTTTIAFIVLISSFYIHSTSYSQQQKNITDDIIKKELSVNIADNSDLKLLAAEFRKTPYLIFPGSNIQMQVQWQLTSTSSCTIEWGADKSYTLGSVQTDEYGDDHQHIFTITDLTPASKYYYRVTSNIITYSDSFYTAPEENATDIKFMAYGDTRTYPADHDQVASAILSTYAEDESFQSFLLVVGDLVDNGNYESHWDDQFFNSSYTNIQKMLSSLPYQSCMGNHEGNGVLFKKYFPYPFVNNRYWSFDYGPAHFVVVDQYTSYSPGSTQLEWIENDLASTTKYWKFIYLHEPGWSADGGHSNEIPVQDYIQPLCEEYNVSILFGGHNHYYARAVVNNVQHITTGGGGAPLRSPDPSYPNIVKAAQAYHFCKIDIHNEILKFEAVTPTGTIIDSFTISTPVPVELTSFTAILSNNQVHLIWETATEINNYGFNIEKCIDGKNWKKIGFVEGHGNSNSPKSYSFIDKEIISAKVQYRLKQIDTDGSFEYSNVIDVNSSSLKAYTISQNYPNPFNPSTKINYSIQKQTHVSLKVFDVLGREVATLVNKEQPAGNYEVVFDASSVSRRMTSGVYFYRITAGNFVDTKKMILLR